MPHGLLKKNTTSELKFFLESIYHDSVNLNCATTLVSGEDFENFLVDTHLAQEFLKIAADVGFEDVEWVLVHRDPLSYLKSLYAELSKHGMVLDYKSMASLIIKFGYVSAGSSNYNYHFIFDIKKYTDLFAKKVSKNLTVVTFNKFNEGFPGKFVLSDYISVHTEDALIKYSLTNQPSNVRSAPEDVEFRYIANFLGVNADQEFYDSNKNLVDTLITHRLKRNSVLLESISQEFDRCLHDKI